MAHLKSLAEERTLTIRAEESGIQGFSVEDLKPVWEEAGNVLSCEENIVVHPGNAKEVAVFEENYVHSVCNDGKQFPCDSRCDRYRYFDRLFCQHTLAVSERNDALVAFLAWVDQLQDSNRICCIVECIPQCHLPWSR